MAKKTVLRTIYMTADLDDRLLESAAQQRSSASRLVRIALEKHLKPGITTECGTPGNVQSMRVKED